MHSHKHVGRAVFIHRRRRLSSRNGSRGDSLAVRPSGIAAGGAACRLPAAASSTVTQPRCARPHGSSRTYPLPGVCLEALQRHRVQQAKDRLSAGEAWTDCGLVFASAKGTVIEPRNLNRLFDELSAQAGLRRLRFHDLRHTCASLLLAQGVQPRVVMEILGHSQLSITTDLYSHVMPTALRGAADLLDQALGHS